MSVERMTTWLGGLLIATVAGCASGGGGAGTPASWDISVQPLAEGVLVSWNVPRSGSREVHVTPIKNGVIDKELKTVYGASDPGYGLLDLGPGTWELQLKVFDARQPVGSRIVSDAFHIDVSDDVLRPVSGVDAGVAAPLDVPVVCWVPSWSGADALRDALRFVTQQAAQAAFGEATELADEDELEQVLEARRELGSSSLPLGLDARLLMVTDLRPAFSDRDDPTLVVRLYDIACGNHGVFRPRSGRGLPSRGATLLATSFVDVPEARAEAGFGATRELLAGLRAALGEVLAAPEVVRMLPVLARDDIWSTEGQRALLAALTGVGALPPGADIDHALIERDLLFPRVIGADDDEGDDEGDAAVEDEGAADAEMADTDEDANGE